MHGKIIASEIEIWAYHVTCPREYPLALLWRRDV